MGKVHLLSLGCPKNLVDSEKLLRKLRAEGILFSSEASGADIIMVNTCGFIEAAKRESVEEILKAAKAKGKKGGAKLVVYGCLAKRSGEELKKEIPEIDALWGVGEEEQIVEYCRKVVSREAASELPVCEETITNTPYAYLKISEGCDRGCTYCVIPKIRGPYRSRRPEEILEEARALVKAGKKELILIAQDITAYGMDMDGYDLSRLIKDLASVRGDFRIRLLYLYPTSISEELLSTIRTTEKVCKYIDMPLQHSGQRILRLMKRGGGRRYFERLIARIREAIPDVTIRTTLITGFPQETDEDFENMVRFIKKMKFDRLGVFSYSKEEDSAAAKLKGQIPKHVKEKRYRRLMEVQSAVSLEKNEALVGRTFRALVDEVDGEVAIARLCSQAPEIDGVVFLEDPKVKKGEFVRVRIEQAYDYDLKGRVLR